MIDSRTTDDIARDDAKSGAARVNRFRALDTSLGGWTRTDPMGYVDGANVYQFVRSNPTRFVDPLGLTTYAPPDWTAEGGTSHPEFGGVLTLPGGAKAKVDVVTGATLKYPDGSTRSGGIVFQVTTDEGSCADCHFIQFVRAYSYDRDGNPSGEVYRTPNAYRRYGEWYLDTSWTTPESPWYETYGEHSRSDDRLSIYDAPSVSYGESDSRVGHEFQLFLVCDDKVLWKWTWRAEKARGDDGRWRPLGYTPQSGGAATDLGGFTGMDKFPMGFRDPQGTVSIPPYDNPIPAPAGPAAEPTTGPNR